MEKQQYDELREFQKIHWWFRGKNRIIIELFDYYVDKSTTNIKILDIGCGMGLTLCDLKERGEVFGVDMEQDAVEYCRSLFNDDYGKTHIKMGSLPNDLPFDEKFDVIVALDIFEHVENDSAAVKCVFDSLKPDGIMISTVPALMSMWSGNDELNHHFRRYEKKEFYYLLKNVGFSIELFSFYNSFLFLPAFIVRKIKNLLKIKSSDAKMQTKNTLINRLLLFIFSSEVHWLKMNKKFPIGVSLVAIVKKD